MDKTQNKRLIIKWFIICGTISWGLVLIDNMFLHLNLAPLTTAPLRGPAVLTIIVTLSSLPAVLFLAMLCEIKIIRGEWLLWFGFLPQILFYWYMGSLCGRLVVWMRKKCVRDAEKPDNNSRD